MKTQEASPEDISGETSQRATTSPDRHRRRGSLVFVLLGLSLVLVAGGALVVSDSFDERPTVKLAGRDAPVNLSARSNDDISAHNSPTLVRNPMQQNNLAASSRIDTPFFSCALHFSVDGGRSWKQTAIPAPGGEDPKCFAPDVAFASDGTLYLSFLTLGGKGNVPHALWITKSTDGGRTLLKPARVGGELTFQARLAVDPQRPKRVYLSWLQAEEVGTLRFSGRDNPIVVIRTEDGGATWSAPARVSSRARERVVTPVPTVGHDGTLYVLYQDLGDDALNYGAGHEGMGGPPYPGKYTLVLARSRNGGMKWDESVVDTDLRAMSRFVVFLAPAPTVAVDRDGRVYAAFQDARRGDPDVMLWSLDPGEEDWNGPTRVNDTRPGDGTAQYLPKIDVAPDGRLDVVYYDRRADRRNLLNHTSLQSSFDHGRTFTTALRLTSKPSDSRIGFGAKEGLPDLGSRLALVSGDRAALAVWTDTRAGVPETQKQDLAEAAVSISDPARLSDSARDALRYGGLAAGVIGLLLFGYGLWPRTRARPA